MAHQMNCTTAGYSVDSIGRRNSFTFLRLVFSLAVVTSHSFAIGGFGDDPLRRVTAGQVTLGFGAVLCFFIVSGFLITASAASHPLWRFMLNRAARILPGFWIVQLLTALVLAPILILTKYPAVEGYFESLMLGRYSALSYLGSNAFFHMAQYQIVNIFSGLPVEFTINGSLWSLGPEVMCYIYMGLLAFCGGLRMKIVTLVLFGVAYGVHLVACFDPGAVQLVDQYCAKGGVFLVQNPYYRSLYVGFLDGALLFQYRQWLRWRLYLCASAVVLLIIGCWLGCFELVWPFVLPYVVLYLAFRLPFHNVERWGDFSFGIYIYSFPLQQCLALAGVQQFGVFPFISVSIGLACTAGVLSWRWIEEPVLRWTRLVYVPKTRPETSLLNTNVA